MRTLIALTVLMLALASAVWWKTTGSGQPDEVPPTTSNEPNEGIMTIGPGPGSGPVAGLPSDASGTSGEAADASLKSDDEVISEPPFETDDSKELAPPPSMDLIHVVKDGETLYRIVLNAYGTAPAELVEAVATANQLQSSGAIDKDQRLTLPVVEGYPAPSAG